MAGIGSLFREEVARRRSVEEARSKALADPSKMQSLLAKGTAQFVPEGKKIKYKRHPTKHEAVGAAIPKSDPRHGIPRNAWSRYTAMMADPRLEDYKPRDVLAAATNIEYKGAQEATHKYIQKQKTGTFSTFLKEEYAPMPGQEEWEAEHPPPIAKLKAEESFAYGAGFAGLVMAGKSLGLDVASKLYKLSPAKKAALRTALETSKRNPWMKLAVAGGAAIPSMIAYEQVQARSKAAMMKTEVGQEHPLAVEITSHAMGFATGLVGFERAALGVFARKGAADPLTYIKKLKDAVFKKDAAGEAAMDNPAAKEILKFKEATLAAEKASDKAVATVDKSKAAITKNLVEKVEGEALIAKLKDKATPENVGRLDDLISRIRFGSGFAKTEAIAKAGTIARRGILSPEELATKAKLGIVTPRPAEGVVQYTATEKARALKDLMPQVPAVAAAEIGGPLALRSIARPGTIFTPAERAAGEAKGLKVPEKAIVIEQETPNLPMLKPDGSLSSLGSRKIVPYSYRDIKSEEGLDRVLSEVANGKRAVDVVQKVGEMEEGIARHSKVSLPKKITTIFKKKMSELGYDAEEVAGMNAKIASNIETFSKKKESSALLDRAMREPIPQKIGSKVDLSGISTEEKLYEFAKTRTSQQRLDLVERGTISEAINRRIVKEERALIEKGKTAKAYNAEEAAKDAAFKAKESEDFIGSMGTGRLLKEDGSRQAAKADFLLGMMQEKKGKVSTKVLTGLAVGGALASLATPTWELLQDRETTDKTIMETLTTAATTFTLADIFSPAEAEAANLKDLGLVLSGATAVIFKNAKPSAVKKLVEEMKKSNAITKMQVDGCYTLQEFNKPLNIIPNVGDVVRKKSLFPGAEAILSPYIQFLYYTGVRGGQELMNNAAVQWASCQTSSLINTFNGHKTLMNILNDFIPNYRSSAKRAIEVLKPVVEKFHVPMQERAFHLGMARDLKRSYEKEFSKLTKKRKFKKGEADEGLAAVTRLEALYKEHDAAYKASTAMKDEYQAAWTKAMIPFASKSENAGTRIFLAAEDTGNFEIYPWLKDIITWEERAAASKLKDMMEQYSARVIEAGEKVITTRPFMHHPWHPAMKSELERLNKGATLMSPPMTKLHSRSAGYMPMVPDAEYSVTSYLQDINVRLEAMNFWKKGKPDGWAAYKKWLIDNPSQAPEGLIKSFTQFEKGFIPVDTSGGINKFAEKLYALEVARLLAFSSSVPFKHSLKLIADLRVFGMEGVKAAPKAAVAITKIAIKQRGGEEWLKRHGFGLDYLDEAVETYIETGKLYRVVSDISPFRVNETMADRALNKFNEIGGTPTSIVERFDRSLSVVAGIRMAAKKGMTPAQATYAIYDTIIKSNFLSGQLNPSWLRNPAIRLMMIFQGTPFKIMEQRIALHGRAWKGVGETLGQLRRDVIKGEQDFKWEMIKQGFGKQKDIFGNTLLSQSIREMILVGTGITAAKYTWDADLSHHFYHPPFFKMQRRDIAIGASPLVNASVETYSKYMEEDYDDFVVSTFFNSWFDSTYKGIPAPIPVNFKKAARLTENDIPEIYRDSKLRYLFGIPATHD